MGMEVSVVIPCHGGARETLECLRSLRAQDPSPLFDALEILVVDNASPDETATLAGQVPGVRVLRQPSNLGFAGGVNAGLRAARGDFLVILNNDTLAGPNLIHRLLDPLLRDQNIAITAPVSNHVKGVARIDTGDLGRDEASRREIESMLHDGAGGKLQDTESLAGLCLAMSRGTRQRIGEFDELFGCGNYEDDDFCLRARLLGYRLVIVRDAFLHHLGGRTFQALGLNYAESLDQNAARFAEKWRGDPAGRATLALHREDWDAAAAHARTAMDQHSRWADGHLILGRWHSIHGRWSRALPHLWSYLSQCPLHTDAWVLMGAAILRTKGEAAGLDCFRESLATCFYSQPATLDVIRTHGAWLLHGDRPAEAAEKLREGLELDPEDAHMRTLLAKALLDDGHPELAVESFRAAYGGGDTAALVGLGVSQWHSGAWQDGLRTMVLARAELPDDPQALSNLANALAALDAQGVETSGLRRLVEAGAPGLGD